MLDRAHAAHDPFGTRSLRCGAGAQLSRLRHRCHTVKIDGQTLRDINRKSREFAAKLFFLDRILLSA
jgi:hypothetical protein